VLPGGRVPADGELLQGTTYMNEAMITGEAHPVFKHLGE
jgi:P-type E1-E2 ATPase